MQKRWSILDPAQCWGAVTGGGGGVGRALAQDWGEHGEVVPISDFIRLAGMQILI